MHNRAGIYVRGSIMLITKNQYLFIWLLKTHVQCGRNNNSCPWARKQYTLLANNITSTEILTEQYWATFTRTISSLYANHYQN